MEQYELLIDYLFPIIFKRTIPELCDLLVLQSLTDEFYLTPQANYPRMDYLQDKGYDVIKLLNLDDSQAKGYRQHRYILEHPDKERHYCRDTSKAVEAWKLKKKIENLNKN